ncbi:hypothetical protein F9L16_20000 [Agarivorans sp. B2Z047]|uniref:hypothetical protein n=1 Tax=Agarivorans sp. B2Z047 TaxID=2652721 RepID=UPI00128D20BB|nr:hypothetical protein [Agarivorans sp. B2Z047]MPW31260.1 hypothetical protein [Agarivorans sp. B2Z047]UQN42774.1 hypothetical protein LQZ07_23865 [Agarivorans sp. B2Z047]
MQSRIPLPTDNIYKFYALFGLLLLISGMTLFLINYSGVQQRASDRFLELSVLEELKEPSVGQLAKIELLTIQAKVDKSNNAWYSKFIGAFIGISITLIVFGFWKWHTIIQPRQDKLLDKQIEKLELEIAALQKPSRKMLTRN